MSRSKASGHIIQTERTKDIQITFSTNKGPWLYGAKQLLKPSNNVDKDYHL